MKDDPKSGFYFNLFWLTKMEENPKATEEDEEEGEGIIIGSTHEKMAAEEEMKSLFRLASPIAATAVLLYFRSAISMAFLGRLGDAELAGGSLAIAFANISGYSILSGLALGMEPLCSQAFGARRPRILSVTLHRTVIFLLASSVLISFLWLNVSEILLFLRQDREISNTARRYRIRIVSRSRFNIHVILMV